MLDWHSRYVLSWQLSNTLDVGFYLLALADALRVAPVSHIFNSAPGFFLTEQNWALLTTPEGGYTACSELVIR